MTTPLPIIGTGGKPVLKVQDILTDESKWTKGFYAANEHGACDYNSPRATCFCLQGAIFRVYGTDWEDATEKVERRLREKYPHHGIEWFNDQATFAEVRGLIEELDL